MEIIEHDAPNRRTVTMWDECGMRFRSNFVRPGGQIQLHAHNYDHVALITNGLFDCTVIEPDGTEKRFTVAARSIPGEHPARLTILAWHQHRFELREGEWGEVLCFWPIGHDGNS